MILIPSSFRISLSCLIFISLLQSTFLQNNFVLQTTFVATKCLPINCCFLTNYCCSVAKSCLTLCDPMDGNISGSPVLHYPWSLLKLIAIESVMPSNHLLLCCPLLLLSSIFPGIRVFLALHIRWPKLLEFQLQHQSFQWIVKVDFSFFIEVEVLVTQSCLTLCNPMDCSFIMITRFCCCCCCCCFSFLTLAKAPS